MVKRLRLPRYRRAWKAFCFIVGITATLSVATFVVVYSNSTVQTGPINFSGTLESNYSMPLSAEAQTVILSSQPDPFAQADSQGLSWQRTGLSQLGNVFLPGSGVARHVEIVNSTGVLVQDFNASNLLISYQTFPTCSYLALFDSNIEASLASQDQLVDIVYTGSSSTAVRFSPADGDLYSQLNIQAESVRPTSSLFLACDNLNLTADGRQVVLSQRSTLHITDFESASIQVYASLRETLDIWGPALLTLQRGNAYWGSVWLALTTSTGGARIHRGAVDLLGFDALAFSFPSQPDNSQGFFGFATGVTGTAARVLFITNGLPDAVNPVSVRSYIIPDENTRQVLAILVPLLMGAVLSLAAEDLHSALKMAREEHPSETVLDRPSPDSTAHKPRKRDWRQWKGRVVILLLVAMAVIIVIAAPVIAKSNRPILYFLATQPIRIHVMMEATTNNVSIQAAYGVVVPVLQQILGNHDITTDFTRFPDDHVTSYGNDATAFQPAGQHPWDVSSIILSGKVDLYVVHHDGYLDGSLGINSDAVSVLFSGQEVQPLEEARTILEFLGHGWGLSYNPCSPIMLTAAEGAPVRAIPPEGTVNQNFMVDGVDLYSEAVNQSLIAPPTWGTQVVSSLSNVVFSNATTTITQDVYLFESKDGSTFYQVVRSHVTGSTSAPDWVEFGVVMINSYLRGWTPDELDYIHRAISGQTPATPQPGTEC